MLEGDWIADECSSDRYQSKISKFVYFHCVYFYFIIILSVLLYFIVFQGGLIISIVLRVLFLYIIFSFKRIIERKKQISSQVISEVSHFIEVITVTAI